MFTINFYITWFRIGPEQEKEKPTVLPLVDISNLYLKSWNDWFQLFHKKN